MAGSDLDVDFRFEELLGKAGERVELRIGEEAHEVFAITRFDVVT
jgi:hypothetical protein